MGFKRTAEGRVFFDNPDDQEENKDLQIVGLLRALNERLKTAQSERGKLLKEMDRYRDTIGELEERAARSEQAYIHLEQKISTRQNESAKKVGRTEEVTREALEEVLETREMLTQLQGKTLLDQKSYEELKAELEQRKKTEAVLRRHQLALEKLHKDQNEKIVGSVAAYVSLTKRVNENETKFDTLDNKIEEAISEHSQLARKIEKAAQDRSRMLRKVDRIEETVIQTRDALNAKAMVVLADQGTGGVVAQKADEPALLEDGKAAAGLWWQKFVNLQTTGVTTVLIAGLLAGLLLSEIQGSREAQLPMFEKELSETKVAVPSLEELTWQPVFDKEEEAVQAVAIEPEPDEIEPVPFETEPFETDPLATDRGRDIRDDIGALDLNNEDQLLAALESNPDAVAARLNEIEPGALDEAAPVEVASIEPAVMEPELPAPAPAQDDLRARIKADRNLPAKIKEIERQAFDGVPEAQHDLAAIYTAGHGGVTQSYKKAAVWFREAADAGIANARYNLGVLYHQGLGVYKDIEQAIAWYETAATLGHPEAQYNLGIAYIEGVGVEYDPQKAAVYFENAAGKGITEAAYNLGLIHENALLGTAKPDEALKWYKTAADAGSPEAKAALEQLAKTLNIKLSDVNRIADEMGGGNPVNIVPEAAAVKKVPVKRAAKPVASESENVVTTSVVEEAPPAPSAAMLKRNSDRIVTAQVQQYLMQLGLYPGPADGLIGPLTQDAIRSYQLFNDMDADGLASEGLLGFMQDDPQINEVGSREQ